MNWVLKIVEHIKGRMKNQDKRKIIENTIIVIVIGIIIIIASGSFFRKDSVKEGQIPASGGNSTKETVKVVTPEEKSEIENILSQIEGAGRVSIMITYFSGKEIVPAYDSKSTESNTNERDNGGGTKSINQIDSESKMVFEEEGGNKKPIIIKELQPEVKGVIVVAEGAGDVQVRERLCKAVQVLMDVPIHRIQVFQRKK